MKLPNKIRITQKVSYELCYVDSFDDKDCYGECRFDTKQIAIKKGLTQAMFFKTLIHEIHHALDYEHGISLTHKQVYQLENAVYRLMRLNKWLK